MRNKIIPSYLILLSLATIFSLYIPKTDAAKEELVIPNEAIRLRILANSDSEYDQDLKRQVRDAVNAEITTWVQDLTSLEDARAVIKSRLPEIQKIAEGVVEDHHSAQAVKVKFDQVQFPTKLYGQFLYPAGEYEAILVTLGEGKGANWWCVLFPPLCFLDFSNGVAVSSDGFEDGNSKEEKAPKEVKADHDDSKNRASEVNDSKMKTLDSKSDSNVKASNSKSDQNSDGKNEIVNSKTETKESQIESIDKASAPEVKEEKESFEQQAEEKDAAPVKQQKNESKTPVYTPEDEQDVKVKFFVVEVFTKIFS